MEWNKIQDKWQKKWEKAKLGEATVDQDKEKFMMIFAYPGISGFLHVGHMRGFSYTDAICRLERMKGKQILFPVGTHASGNQAFAFANKIKNKDQKWIDYLIKNGCPKDRIKDLEDPHKVIDYFNEVYVNDYWKKFGFLVDWDRFTCSTYPDYEKFIQWQFKKLQQKDLLVQKPYFATACINCGPVAVDPSETDISKGGNAEKNEYTLLKFKLQDNKYLVAATLRPETVFGQTNLWINPDGEYVRVEVEGESWIMSREAAEKLSYQIDDVIVKEDVDPKKLLGHTALAPGVEREIPILPATFCDPKVGSGIVTSVPSDAPYDYVALQILREDTPERKELNEKYGIKTEIIDEIELIPIIKSEGYGNFPAKEIVDRLKIKSLDQPDDKAKLEEATKEIYKLGFHTGVMRDNCNKFSGMKVTEAKEAVKLMLIEKGKASQLHDLSEEVICRCGGKVIIKRIDDQWFIKYSDPELTERSKEQATEMKIYPQEYQDQMPKVLDWFSDRACARLGNWMGSKFPFDDRWTIEPISDSTLYPAYYIVAKFTKKDKNGKSQLKVEELTEEFFDYVFLGEEKKEIIANLSEEKLAIWQEVRKEFDYFYPLDINLGGKEHKTVHFPVFLMNHVAIMPENKWPRGIFVNWWVTGKGSKISKSKGGAVPIPDAVEKYGVDTMRLYYAHIGSPHIDVVWDEDIVINYKNSLEKITLLFEELGKVTGNEHSAVDAWLESEFNKTVKTINKALEEYSLRELASLAYYNVPELFKWYLRRGGSNKSLIKSLLQEWCKLMCPITPHMSEELAEKYDCKGKEEFVSSSTWPKEDDEKISFEAEAGETLVKKTMEGMRNVLKLAKLEKANKFTVFIAERWLYDLFRIVQSEMEVTRNVGEVIRKVLDDDSMKPKGKEVSKIIGMLLKDPSKIPQNITDRETELNVMQSAKFFLEEQFDTKVEIIAADDSTEAKAKQAMPGKVGILVK